ncbi:hypothetical protein DL98DRAFT_520871 [Cadophora sp. DSE1049]|nr:hypothetical protein DL98DRAFT_520871 [Cadophora sp. DSE1049]
MHLLKSFTASPDSPESMKVVLHQLISLSSALDELKPFLDDPSAIPSEVYDRINIQYLVVPLTSCVMTFSQLEYLVDTIRTDPKRSNRLYARMEGISSLDYINSALPEEDVIGRIENSETYISSRRSWNGAEKEVVGLAVLDDGLDWMSLADYDESRQADNAEDEKLPLFNKRKWDEEQAGTMVKILRYCQEALEILAGLFLGTSQADTSIHRLSELTSQILNDETLKDMHNAELFKTQNTALGSRDVSSPKSSLERAAKQRRRLAAELYLRGDPTKNSSTASLPQRSSSLNIITQLPIPILPSTITNRAWYRFPLPPADPEATTFHITIKSLTEKIVSCKISSTTTCLELKQVIQRTEGPHLHQQYLVCEPEHRWLPEDMVLCDRGVREGSKIHVLLPFWGRGSL